MECCHSSFSLASLILQLFFFFWNWTVDSSKECDLFFFHSIILRIIMAFTTVTLKFFFKKKNKKLKNSYNIILHVRWTKPNLMCVTFSKKKIENQWKLVHKTNWFWLGSVRFGLLFTVVYIVYESETIQIEWHY